MCYLVNARFKHGKEMALLRAIADGTLGQGFIAGDENVCDLQQDQVGDDGVALSGDLLLRRAVAGGATLRGRNILIALVSVKDAQTRKNCRHGNGTENWAVRQLRLHPAAGRTVVKQGKPFLVKLKSA